MTTKSAELPAVGNSFDVEKLRAEFPILERRIDGRPLVYLDSAATSQKPRAVLAAMDRFYEEHYASVARGVHRLSAEATAAYEAARARVAAFLHVEPAEIVFVRGTTEAINLVAATYGRGHVAAGDEIVLTELEHHSNLVPWQRLAEEKGARLRVVPVDDRGDVHLDEVEKALSDRTRIVAVAHVSNALGTVLPVREIARLAHARGVPVLLDGAQGAPHLPLDLGELDCDFYAFSAHKVYGPTGIGALFGRRELLAAMPPYQTGGGMIETVTFEGTTFAEPPHRFEAGTPAAAEAVGFAAALDGLEGWGRERVARWESALALGAVERLRAIPGVRLIGEPRERAGVVSFVVTGVHAHDVGTVLDHAGIAVRAGHHCAQPVMKRFGVPATVRASFAAYNTEADVDALAAAVAKAARLFG